LFDDGKISYSKWGVVDALLWKKTKISKMNEILHSISLVKDVKKTLLELSKRGFYNVIMTSSLSLFTDILSKELAIDRCFANILECRGGRVTGNVEMMVTDKNKETNIKNFCQELNIQPEFCVAVGDSRFDIDMFEIVGFSIALNPNDSLIEEKSDVIIKSDTLMSILPEIDKWLSNKTF
jgi:phosphoserine phosphatase